MLNQSFLGSSLYKKEDAQGKMLISSNFVVYISKKKYKRTLQSLVSYIIKNFLPDIDISLIFFAKNFRNFFCFLASRMIYLLKSYPTTMSNVLKPVRNRIISFEHSSTRLWRAKHDIFVSVECFAINNLIRFAGYYIPGTDVRKSGSNRIFPCYFSFSTRSVR